MQVTCIHNPQEWVPSGSRSNAMRKQHRQELSIAAEMNIMSRVLSRVLSQQHAGTPNHPTHMFLNIVIALVVTYCTVRMLRLALKSVQTHTTIL